MSEDLCSDCGGLGLVQKDGKRVQCRCRLKKLTEVYLRGLQPMTPATKYQGVLDEMPCEGNLLILAPETLSDPGQVKWIFAYLLLRGGIRRTYECLNAYEIVQINFGEHDRYENPGKINSNVLCLFYGYHEAKNSLLADLMLQTLDVRSSRGLYNWILVRGSPTFGEEVEQYAKDRQYGVVDLGRGRFASTKRAPTKTPDEQTDMAQVHSSEKYRPI